ncbi:hypothetical protein HK104_001497 [Borealophlyctis nickersoniae]|nr:hypothetical protein HK104_001497 [Borealophlyctis nickersoniae]
MEKVLVGNAPTVARDRPEIFLRILISEVHEYYFHRQISDHNQRIINYRYADTPMMQTLLHGLHKRSRGDTVSGIGTPQFDSPALAALHGGGPVPLTTTENLKSACQQLVSAQRPWSGRGDPERLLAAQNIAELAEEDRFGSLFTKEGYNIAYLRQAFARLHQRIRKADFEAKLAELVGGYTSKNNRAALTEFLTKGQILMVETMQGFKDDIREYGEDSITDEVSQGLRDTMNHEFGGIIVSRYHEYLRDAFAARLANLQDPHPEINNCCNELKRVIKQFNQGRETINPRDRQASLRRELTQLVKLRDAKQKAEAERMAKQDEIRRLEAEQAARDEEMRQRLAEVERQETQLQDTFAAKLKKEKAKLTKFQQRMSMKVEELRQKQEKIEEEERQRLTQERSCERCGSTFTEAENGPDKCQVDPQYTHSGNLITPKGKALVGGGIGSVALVAGAAALASNPIGWMVGGLLAAGGAVGGAGIGYGLTNMEYSGCGHPDGSDPEELNCNRQEFPKQRHVEYEESSSAGRIVGAGAGALVVARDLFL